MEWKMPMNPITSDKEIELDALKALLEAAKCDALEAIAVSESQRYALGSISARFYQIAEDIRALKTRQEIAA